jgi:hypothetical protein
MLDVIVILVEEMYPCHWLVIGQNGFYNTHRVPTPILNVLAAASSAAADPSRGRHAQRHCIRLLKL